MSGVWSQKGDTSLGDKISLVDATDGIARGEQIPQSASGDGILLLADGSRFTGSLFGAEGWGQGELVFTTGMTGYQESLTDPSFAGQVLTFTYPLIGNYGIHKGTSESAAVWPRGVVVRQAMKNPDHRDSIASLNDFLAYHKVPGIENIDTRAITKKVREYGCLLCVFGPIEEESQMAAHLEQMQSPELEDLVDQVSINEPVVVNQGATDKMGRALPRIAAIDCGIKYNILRSLCNYFEVVWCPPSTTFDEVKSYD
ncbi:MAG: carbamoyl-phosphate synthase domain-containing protein, partial [Euryarchaeota archaeon]